MGLASVMNSNTRGARRSRGLETNFGLAAGDFLMPVPVKTERRRTVSTNQTVNIDKSLSLSSAKIGFRYRAMYSRHGAEHGMAKKHEVQDDTSEHCVDAARRTVRQKFTAVFSLTAHWAMYLIWIACEKRERKKKAQIMLIEIRSGDSSRSWQRQLLTFTALHNTTAGSI